ncbi:MAG: hypothetical protein ABSG25_15320 [Bryobacteraceae bacterium]
MEPVQQDQEHVRLLSIFHYVVAAFAALFACVFLIHVGLGIAMLVNPQMFGGHRQEPPPAFAGWLLLIIGSAIVLCGWTFATLICISGRFLSRRKHYMFCLVMAGVECMFMPFGTVLGVFTFVVLLRPGVKQMFAA